MTLHIYKSGTLGNTANLSTMHRHTSPSVITKLEEGPREEADDHTDGSRLLGRLKPSYTLVDLVDSTLDKAKAALGQA